MNILAIDTARGFCSIGLKLDGVIFEDTRKVVRLHNEYVLPMIDALMQRAGIEPRDLGAIAFGCGPGSFTGIRIAASVVQGIALASGASVVPISSSVALAHSWFHANSLSNGRVLTVTRSKKDAWYVAGYALIDGHIHSEIEDHLTTQAFDWRRLEDHDWSIVGDRPDWLGTSPRERYFEEGFELKIGSILALAQHNLKEGLGVDAQMALPVYLSADSPWRPVTPGPV